MSANLALAQLMAAPAHVNAAVALYLEIQETQATGEIAPEALLTLRPRIDAAIAGAAEEARAVGDCFRRLRDAPAAPAAVVPLGF